MVFKDPEKKRAYEKSWHTAYKEKNGKSYYITRARQKTEEIKQILGRCQNCGTTSNLEFAHIKGTPLSEIHRGRGVISRYYDIMNHPDCYTFFCEGCHDLYDAGKLTIIPKSLLELQEEVRVRVFKEMPVIQVVSSD